METVDKFALGNPRRFGYMFVQQENSNPTNEGIMLPAEFWTRVGFVFAADRANLKRMAEGWETRQAAADRARESGYGEFVTAILFTRRFPDGYGL